MKSTLKLSLLVLAGCMLFGLSSCKKEGCTDDTATNYDAEAEKSCDDCCEYEASLSLHLHQKVGNDDLVLNETYQLTDGRSFTISHSRVYLSKIRAHKDDGSMHAFNDGYLLLNTTDAHYTVGTIPDGHYHGLMLNVGVDSLANHSDPANYSSSHPLSLQSPSLHWGWNTGYIFWMLEGRVDTTDVPDGTLDADMVFHVGIEIGRAHV